MPTKQSIEWLFLGVLSGLPRCYAPRNDGKIAFFTCHRASIYVFIVPMKHCQMINGTNFAYAPELTSGGKDAPYSMLA